jgi:phosphate starvation-inducible PhoH-like protein
MGQRSRIVVTGDVTQIDLPEHIPSGLIDAVERLRPVVGVGVVELTGADIVRHPLVRRIVAAYDVDRTVEPPHAAEIRRPAANTGSGIATAVSAPRESTSENTSSERPQP